MVLKQESLVRLKEDLGLNIYEVKVWSVLLSRGIATAGELADLSGVPRSRCYDVLESLDKKGFIMMKIGKPIKYIAIKPDEIVERVKKDIKEDTDLSLKMIEDIKETDIFKELDLLHKTGIDKVESSDLSNSIIGRENVNYFLKHMIDRAQESVMIVTTADGFIRKVNLLHKVLKRAHARGVNSTIIAPLDERLAKKVNQTTELVNKEHNSRFVIVDNKETLFMLTDGRNEKAQDAAVWLKSKFFTSALSKIFSARN